jgi:hypothetical protein
MTKEGALGSYKIIPFGGKCYLPIISKEIKTLIGLLLRGSPITSSEKDHRKGLLKEIP